MSHTQDILAMSDRMAKMERRIEQLERAVAKRGWLELLAVSPENTEPTPSGAGDDDAAAPPSVEGPPKEGET